MTDLISEQYSKITEKDALKYLQENIVALNTIRQEETNKN